MPNVVMFMIQRRETKGERFKQEHPSKTYRRNGVAQAAVVERIASDLWQEKAPPVNGI